jgi:hypothetical protein
MLRTATVLFDLGTFLHKTIELNFAPIIEDFKYIAHLRQQCHNSEFVIFQEKRLNILKCYNFL